MATAAVIDKLTQQILAQGTTDKWTGTGKGSAEANATEMARIIAGTGVTDISQFGAITKPADVEVIPIFQPVLQGQGDSQEYVNQVVGYQDASGNIVDPSKVNVSTDYGGETGNITTTYIAPVGTQTTYGNKATGQEVANTYGERQTGNAFGGTFEGSGNTGYRVDLSSGTPVFYTTKASSNDLFNLLADNPLLNVGANVLAGIYGGPAGVAALNAAQGKDFKDVATATLLAYAAQAGDYLGGGTTPAAGNGAFLGENVVSGVPAFDTAFTNAGGAFNSAFGLPVGNGAFLGEGVPTGINAWDTAYTNAGGVFNPAFALGPDGLVGTPLVTPPAVATPAVTTPVVNPPVTPPVVNPPVVPPTPPIVPPVPPIVPPTITDILKVIAPIATIAAAANVVTPKTTTPTGFDIVPVPTDWKTPNKPTTAPYTPLTPIDFGTRELLRGTQWEKFLDPNYGQVPEAVKYSQPSSMSYNDLMSILGSKQGMPSASGLSINDIISGIQNQYGQVPSSTMG